MYRGKYICKTLKEVRRKIAKANDIVYEGEAMNTVLECLDDFKKENQYYNYRYLRRDNTKFFKDDKNMKWAVYHSYVQFTR